MGGQTIAGCRSAFNTAAPMWQGTEALRGILFDLSAAFWTAFKWHCRFDLGYTVNLAPPNVQYRTSKLFIRWGEEPFFSEATQR